MNIPGLRWKIFCILKLGWSVCSCDHLTREASFYRSSFKYWYTLLTYFISLSSLIHTLSVLYVSTIGWMCDMIYNKFWIWASFLNCRNLTSEMSYRHFQGASLCKNTGTLLTHEISEWALSLLMVRMIYLCLKQFWCCKCVYYLNLSDSWYIHL